MPTQCLLLFQKLYLAPYHNYIYSKVFSALFSFSPKVKRILPQSTKYNMLEEAQAKGWPKQLFWGEMLNSSRRHE